MLKRRGIALFICEDVFIAAYLSRGMTEPVKLSVSMRSTLASWGMFSLTNLSRYATLSSSPSTRTKTVLNLIIHAVAGKETVETRIYCRISEPGPVAYTMYSRPENLNFSLHHPLLIAISCFYLIISPLSSKVDDIFRTVKVFRSSTLRHF